MRAELVTARRCVAIEQKPNTRLPIDTFGPAPTTMNCLTLRAKVTGDVAYVGWNRLRATIAKLSSKRW